MARAKHAGIGRSAASYAEFDLDPFSGFAEEALKTVDAFGASLDVIESRLPEVSKLIYSVIGKGLMGTQENIKNTEEAIKRIDSLLEGQFKKMAQHGKEQQKISRDVGMSLTNAVMKFGRETRKMYNELGEEEAKLYEEWNQRRINDTKKDTMSKKKLLKAMFVDLTTDEVKGAVMAPFQHAIDEFKRFRQTVAGKALGYFIPGKEAIKSGFNKVKGTFLKAFQGDIWSNVIKLVFTGVMWVVDKIKKVLQFDVFDFISKKFAEIKKLFEQIPGWTQAGAAFQNIQDSLSQIRQEFGGTVQQSRELTEAIYAASNAVIRVEDNTRALLAVQEAGVRGTERQAYYMEQVALLSKSTGVSDAENLEYLLYSNRVLGATAEDAFAMAASIDAYADSMAASQPYAASTADHFRNILGFQDEIQRMVRMGFGTAETIQQDIMALTQWEVAAGVAAGTAVDVYTKFGTMEGIDFMGALLNDPEEVRERIASGDLVGVYKEFLDNWNNLATEEQSHLLEEALSNGLNLAVNDIELLSNSVGDLDFYFDEATGSVLSFEEGLARTTQQADDQLTPLKRLDGQLEDLANSFSIGGIRMGEVNELMEVFDTRLGVFTQGFSLAGQTSDFIFGPLSPIAKMITGAPLALAALGGLVGDFSEEFADFGGPLGSFFAFSKETVDTVWPQVKEVLDSVWQGIVKYFTDSSYGTNADQTLFGLMLTTGVDWVVNNGPKIIQEVTTVAVEMLGALEAAFDTLEESGLGTALSTMFVSALEAAIPIIKGAVGVFISMANAFIDVLGQVIQDPLVAPAIGKFVEDLFSVFTGAMNDAGGVLQNAFETFKDYALPFFHEVGEELGMALMGIIAEFDVTGAMRGRLGVLRAERLDRQRTAEADELGLEGFERSHYMTHGRDITSGSGLSDMEFSTEAGSGFTSTLNRLGESAESVQALTGSIARTESSGENLGVNPQGAVGYYQMLPDTASTAYGQYLAQGGDPFQGYSQGHKFSDEEINRLSQSQQRRLAQTHLMDLYSKFAESPSPMEFTLAAYNAGEHNVNTRGNTWTFEEWANNLLRYPKSWIAQSGLGYQTVTYVLRNKYLMDNPGAGSWGDDDALYQHYLGWDRMPVPGDFGYPAPRTWEGRPASIDDVADGTYTDFQGFLSDSEVAGLAQGGIVTEATLAMIGEGGQNEAVIPLDDWKRDEDRRHQESISELRSTTRELSSRLESILRAMEEDGFLSSAMGAR